MPEKEGEANEPPRTPHINASRPASHTWCSSRSPGAAEGSANLGNCSISATATVPAAAAAAAAVAIAGERVAAAVAASISCCGIFVRCASASFPSSRHRWGRIGRMNSAVPRAMCLVDTNRLRHRFQGALVARRASVWRRCHGRCRYYGSSRWWCERLRHQPRRQRREVIARHLSVHGLRAQRSTAVLRYRLRKASVETWSGTRTTARRLAQHSRLFCLDARYSRPHLAQSRGRSPVAVPAPCQHARRLRSPRHACAFPWRWFLLGPCRRKSLRPHRPQRNHRCPLFLASRPQDDMRLTVKTPQTRLPIILNQINSLL